MDRLKHSIDYIETNLARDLTVGRIAQAACYSPYHFARSFRLLTGWSVMAYVQARRLTLAAERLRADDRNGERVALIELAFDSGFESQAAFTRAFKRKFKQTPGAFRRLGGIHHDPTHTPRLVLARDFSKGDPVMLTPRFTDRLAFMAAGLKGHYEETAKADIGNLWERFGPLIGQIPHAVEGPTYGICFPPDKTDGRFDYFAAIEVSDYGELPGAVEPVTVPAQHYAVFTHRISNPDITRDLLPTLSFIWESWLPASDYDFTGGPDFELYDERFDPFAQNGLAGEFDIYIPVRAK